MSNSGSEEAAAGVAESFPVQAPSQPPSVLRAALEQGEETAIARIVIDKAKAGDVAAARFVIGLLCPRPRGRAVTLALPPNGTAGDIAAAFEATLRAMAAGEITPDEALIITRVLDRGGHVFKAWQEEWRSRRSRERLAAYWASTKTRMSREQDDENGAAETLAEPAPPGSFDKRSGGQGEGLRATNDGTRLRTPTNPLPDLPERLAKGRTGEGDGGVPRDHLHSTCIQEAAASNETLSHRETAG
jgi:hypothetical protein